MSTTTRGSALSVAERERILEDFNGNRAYFPADRTLVGLFEDQVRDTPDAPALVAGEVALSYAELNGRANRLAHRLRALGAGRQSVIGILVDRSPEMLVGLLGILKAGGAYLPLDPKYPLDRMQFMMTDSAADILVTQAHFRGKVGFAGHVVDLDTADLGASADTDPEPVNEPTDLACVIFTSGSTGRPKGVLLEHRSIVNWSWFFAADARLTPADRVAKHASFSFDASLLEIFPTFLSGATLVLVPEDIRLALNDLNRFFEAQRITVAFFTTQLAEQFNALVDNRSLRVLYTGGEKLRTFTPRRYRFVNIYGPTETTVAVTSFEVDRAYENIPIGRPVPNCRIYILAKDGTPQPVGAPGELCVGGVPLGRGYQNRPELTAEKWVDDPFRPGERIYRTGDLAQWQDDGTLLHLGRIDRQVKMRGFRIELGEIEQALLAMDEVREAAVVAHTDGQGRVALAAYYVGARETPAAAVKSRLARALPEFMVPQSVVALDAMPLTPSGKIDRLALPAPEVLASAGVEYAAPRDDRERTLAAIWQEVLGVERVGIDDDFLALGGHSLKAVLVQARVENELGVRVPLKALLQQPTIRRQSAVFESFAPAAVEAPTPAPPAEWYPVTSSQAQLFLLEQLSHIGTTYNIPICLSLEGPLDVRALSDALDALVQRHEALRTSFTIVGGVPVQRVHPTVKLKKVLREIAEAELDAAIAEFVRPFNLERAPLLRAQLLRTAPDRHHLLLDIHHIVFDGVSYGLLIRELGRLYRGEALPELPLQFKDFAVWAARRAEAKDVRALEPYWLETLAEPPVLDLPLDHRRSPEADFRGARVEFGLDFDTVAELEALAREENATLHGLLLAATSVLLHKYTRQEDLVVGTPLAGRLRAECDPMVGMFVNTVPVRCRPARDKTFRELLRETAERMLDIQSNQEFPLDRVYEQVATTRQAGRNPLFDVIFVLQNMEAPVFSGDGDALVGRCRLLDTGTAKFDLNFTAEERQGQLELFVEYRPSLFDAGTIEQLVRHFRAVLDAVRVNPEQTIRQIRVLDPQEEHRLLEEFNRTAADWPHDATVHRLFEEQADRWPDRVAVEYGDERLTYREVEVRANNLAAKIRAAGIGPDGIVGIFLERGTEMVVAALAVLKAGGAYLPVIPDYPPERINYIFGDSRAGVLISTASLATRLDFAGPVFDVGAAETWAGDGARLGPSSGPAHMAYVIYTSGSTGKPKGVMVEHRNLVRLMRNDRFQFDLDERDAWTLFHSFSFDFSVWEMYGALLFGGRLVIVPKAAAQSPAELRALLAEKKITVLSQTPGAFYNLVEEDQRHETPALRGLRYVVFGGEALKPVLLKPFRERHPATKLINMYGITETTVHVTYKEITAQEIETNVSNIGGPIPTMATYIMDTDQQLVPLGVAGELCVGGAGVTRGYLNKEELTAQRFIRNPYNPAEPLYRSGDLARRLATGEMEYLGRIDFQIQLRGFRVELGEIENELLKYEPVNKVALLAREEGHGELFLCAYYTAATELPVKAIREFLARRLPDYMIPSYFIHLDELPLTSNGKVDRQALPAPGADITTGAAYVAPRTPDEERIAAVWREVLGVERVGLDDDFFALGGHSMKAVALASKLQDHFRVSVNDIFTHPTVGELAAHIEPIEGNLKSRLLALKGAAADLARDDTPAVRAALDAYRTQTAGLAALELSERKTYRHLLLTGATGYLGCYLLRDLLRDTEAHVSVIVRGESTAVAAERLAAKLAFSFGDGVALGDRVTVLAGDLSRPELGLSAAEYGTLAANVDGIIHTAANVRHFGRYEEFVAANVTATANVLALAEQGSKDVHHVSTMSVGLGRLPGTEVALFTELDSDVGQQCDNVYVKTKLAAEQLVLAARARGRDARIYRLGNITFARASGAFQENVEDNAFFQQVKAYANLGLVPDLLDERDLSYVDEVSRAILTLYDRPALRSQTFHLENPHRVKLSAVLTDPELGLNVTAVPFAEFIDYLAAHYDRPGLRSLIENLMLHMGWLDDAADETRFVIPTGRTVALLARAGFAWSAATATELDAVVRPALAARREFLAGLRLGTELPSEVLERLAKGARLRCWDDGHDLFWEGEIKPKIYVLQSGSVELSRRSRAGWSGTLAVAGVGDLLGEEHLVGDGPAAVTAEAVLGDVLALEFEAADLGKLLAGSPRLALNLLGDLSAKIDRLQRMVLSLG